MLEKSLQQALYMDGEIRPVIQIETTQKVLVGLAFAAVLGGDETEDEFQQLRRARHGPVLELILASGADRDLEIAPTASAARGGIAIRRSLLQQGMRQGGVARPIL